MSPTLTARTSHPDEDLFLTLNEIPVDDRPVQFDRMIAKSPAMKRVFRRIIMAANTDVPVLVLGETGTGKDLVAQSIHRRSARRSGPFVAVNVGAIPRELVAAELFGYERGAHARRPGKFELASGGTLFLDEITAMDPRTQVAFLRALEAREFYRMGGAQPTQSAHRDVRVIAATSADLPGLVREGKFRRDLLYRLEVFPVTLPPLRERPGAIRLLCEEFQRTYRNAFHLPVRGFEPEAMRFLERYQWPGNVRELKNVIQRVVLVARHGLVSRAHLPERIVYQAPKEVSFTFPPGRPLKDLEREYLRRTLLFTHGNKARAARLLRISRKTLYQKLSHR